MALGVAMAIAGVLGLLLVLLALPVDVRFMCRGVEGFGARLGFRCLLGLLRFGVDLPRDRRPRRTARRTWWPVRAAAPRPAATASSRPQRANVMAVLRQADFRRRVLWLARQLLRAAHLQQLRLRLRLGLGDPADTGRLWAVMGPLGALAANLRDAQVQIEPEFIDPVLEFQAEGRARLVPVQLLALLLVFVLSPSSLRAWRILRSGRG